MEKIITTKEAIYEDALATYGAEAQTRMVFEEMAELQKELCKHGRGKDNLPAIAEEIADVQIMLEQMIVLHECDWLVADFKAKKLARLAVNLAKAKREAKEREVIAQLERLKEHCQSMHDDEGWDCGEWDKDVAALAYALEVLKNGGTEK